MVDNVDLDDLIGTAAIARIEPNLVEAERLRVAGFDERQAY